MARRRVESTPLAGKVDFVPRPEMTASPFESTAQENGALRQTAIEDRVSAIEKTLAALIFSTFGARDARGHMLLRCRCGCFAIRRVSLLHPVAGIQREYLCGNCAFSSPLATEGIEQTEEDILTPADLVTVTRVNHGLIQAQLWGGS